MKCEYKDLPNFYLNKEGMWEVFNYSRVLVSIPETEEEVIALEE